MPYIYISILFCVLNPPPVQFRSISGRHIQVKKIFPDMQVTSLPKDVPHKITRLARPLNSLLNTKRKNLLWNTTEMSGKKWQSSSKGYFRAKRFSKTPLSWEETLNTKPGFSLGVWPHCSGLQKRNETICTKHSEWSLCCFVFVKRTLSVRLVKPRHARWDPWQTCILVHGSHESLVSQAFEHGMKS